MTFLPTRSVYVGRDELVAGVGVDGPRGFHGFGQAAANGAEDEGWDGALRRQGEISGLRRKFDAAVEAEAGFAQEFGAEAHVFGAIDAPEPELFFVALQEIDGFLELFHGFIEVGSQIEDPKQPSVAGVPDANAHAIFPGLIAFDGAAVIVANCRNIADCGHAAWHGAHQSLKVLALGAIGFSCGLRPSPRKKARPLGNGVRRNQGFTA